MALLTSAQLQTLDYSYQGLPSCNISFISSTTSLDYSHSGLPFVGTVGSFIRKVLISGQWKDISEIKILISGVWKAVTDVYVLVSGSWRINT